jgi:uncharacterized protein YqgC (DUF456 family)
MRAAHPPHELVFAQLALFVHHLQTSLVTTQLRRHALLHILSLLVQLLASYYVVHHLGIFDIPTPTIDCCKLLGHQYTVQSITSS